MDSSSVNRAILSSGLWVAVSFAICTVVGTNFDVMDLAVDGALMGASALGSDLILATANLPSSTYSSAIATGAVFTALQKAYRGSNDYLFNFGLSAVNDYGVSVVAANMA